MGQIAGIVQHLALMSGIAVEGVDAGTDDRFGIEVRPDLAEMIDVGFEHLLRRLVDVGDDEIAIDHHDRGRDVLDRGLQMRELVEFAIPAGRRCSFTRCGLL